MAVRLNIPVSEETWRALRDLAESSRLTSGRASVASVVLKLIDERLSADKTATRRA